MAEETVHCLPDSPDVNRSWRRISTRKLSFLYTEETLLPNYLRSPTGSCHDACKYGRKHESEEDKPRASSPLKRVNRSFSGTIGFDSPLRKKTALIKPVLNPSLGSDGSGCEHVVRRVCDAKKKQNVSLSDSKRNKTVSHSFKMSGVSRRRALEKVEHEKRVTALKLKSVAQTAAMALRRSTVNRKKTNGGFESEEPKKVVVPLRATMSSKRCARSLKTKKERNNLSSVPLNQSRRKRVDDKCRDLVEEKTLYVIKMNTGNETVASDHNQRCVMDQPSDDPMSEKCQEEAECVVTESPQEEEAEEVDEANDESPQEVEKDEEKEEESIENEKTTRQVKSKPLSTESALNGKSIRLRFKRGKVLDVVGSQDNNNPRKLKFKRGKIVVTRTDTSSKSASQRSLKTKRTNSSNDNEQQQHNPKPLEVVLKHQEDTEEKSVSRALLFNNVIEETANKLVETHKSKVKALVGAFESVISLQERNSSPANL